MLYICRSFSHRWRQAPAPVDCTLTGPPNRAFEATRYSDAMKYNSSVCRTCEVAAFVSIVTADSRIDRLRARVIADSRQGTGLFHAVLQQMRGRFQTLTANGMVLFATGLNLKNRWIWIASDWTCEMSWLPSKLNDVKLRLYPSHRFTCQCCISFQSIPDCCGSVGTDFIPTQLL
jgi:hypothetical protein